MNSQIASFYASLGFKLDQRSFAAAEKALKKIQETMAGFKKFQNDLTLTPKIKFNSLNLQRDAQRSLNQVSRLLEVKLSKFNLDPSQLTRSLDSAIRRAQFSANSVKVRAVVERSTVSQGARAAAREAVQSSANGAGGVAGLVAASRAGVAGIAGYAGYSGLVALNDQVNDVQDRVIKGDTAKMLIGQAVGGSETRKTNALDYYRQTTNRLGTDAEGGIRDFNSLLVNQRMAGTSTRDALRNWELIQKRATFAHLGADQQQRFVRQLIQIQGKGVVTQEDLSTIGDSDSGFKSTLIQAYAQKKGWSGNMQDWSTKYAADQKAGKVKWEDVINALSLSARRYAKEIEESSNSLRADAQRTANSKFWTDVEKNGEALTQSLKDRNEAEQRLYEASVPLQKMFIDLVQIPVVEQLTQFSNGLTGIAEWFNKYNSLPDSQKNDTLWQGAKDTASWVGQRLAKNNAIGWAIDSNILGAGDAYDSAKNFVLGKSFGSAPGYRIAPDYHPYQQSDTLQQMQSISNPTTNQMMLQIAPGAFNIEINAASGDISTISSELERSMSDITDRVILNKLSEARFQYPSNGR